MPLIICLIIIPGAAISFASSTVSAAVAVKYTLTVSATGEGAGTVISSPKGINCSTCSKAFKKNRRVRLRAKPAIDAKFAGWGGACSAFGTRKTCVVKIDEDKSVTAQFDAIPKYTLTVSKGGTGIGTVTGTPGGIDQVINCGANCSAVYLLKRPDKPVRVILKAVPALDATFDGWEGACAGSGKKTSCSLKMDADKTAVAKFDALPRFTITVTQGGGGTGTVIGIPRGFDKTINCGSDCSATYLLNDPAKPTSVTLIARAAAGSIFAGWSGQCTGTDPCVIFANENKTVRAAFISRSSTQIQADSLGITSAVPGALLTVDGTGFDLRSSFFVRFTSGGPFSFDIPAVDVRPSSVSAIVPPFFDEQTSQFISGVVNVQVVQKSDDSTVVSPPISDFRIEDLPSPLALPGVVTLSLLLANVDLANLEQNNIPGTLFDTDAIFASLLTQVNNFSALTTNIERLLQDESRTFNIGSIDGSDITITSSDVRAADRLVMGLMLALGANQATTATAQQSPHIADGRAQGCAAAAANAFVKKAMEPNTDLATLAPLAREVYSAHSKDAACKSADAFESSYKIIGGAGGIGMGFLAKPAAAAALPSAALLYVATEGAGGLIGLEGAIGQPTPAASDMVQNGISIVKDTMQNTVVKAPLSGTTGNFFDLTVGAHSLRQAVISAPPHGKGESYRLSVSKNGAGSIVINPEMFVYAPGTVVALEAIPDSGFAFAGWSGACSGNGACTLVMTSDKAVNATFNPISTASISGTWIGNWTVSNPGECNGISGTWAAVFTDDKGALSGTWQSTDGSSGSLSGTHYGDTVKWSVGGGSSVVAFSGTISGTTISGDFLSSLKCLDKGTLSGVFSGSRL